jgi:hypothetical protein
VRVACSAAVLGCCQDGWQRKGLRRRRSYQAHVLRHACHEQGGLGSGHEPAGVRVLPAYHRGARVDPHYFSSREVRLSISSCLKL